MLNPSHAPELFPSFVGRHSLTFTLDFQFPGEVLPESLSRAVPKRQAEFLAGRACAREALRIVAPEHAAVALGIGERREPLWPAGIVGAITHSHGLAAAAIARTRDAKGIGLDVEQLMADEQATRVLESIAGATEISSLQRATGWNVSTVLTLVFSAKETIFKCLYPQVGRYFDFRDAVVTALGPAGRFSAHLLSALTPALPSGFALEGRFVRDATSVCTAMVLAVSQR